MAKQPIARKRPASRGVGRARPKKKLARGDAKASRKKTLADARPPAYDLAIRLYEKSLQALQRRQLRVAATGFEQVIDQFPEEKELHERSRRYLRVCERESQTRSLPKTVEERVYAATLALNAGAHDEALHHLRDAERQSPDSDPVQYLLAMALVNEKQPEAAVAPLLRSIELNPDNRYLAREEALFERLREDEAVKKALEIPLTAPQLRTGS